MNIIEELNKQIENLKQHDLYKSSCVLDETINTLQETELALQEAELLIRSAEIALAVKDSNNPLTRWLEKYIK